MSEAISLLSRLGARLMYWSWKNALLDGKPERKRRALEHAMSQADPKMASVILDYLILLRHDAPDIDERLGGMLHAIGQRDSRQLVRLLAQTKSTYEGDYGARTRALALGQALVNFRDREWDLAALLQTARESVVRLAAVCALRGQNAPVAPALLLGVVDANEEIQIECIHGLSEIELTSDDILAVRETLEHMLHVPRYPLRCAAAKTLQKKEWWPLREPELGLLHLSLGNWDAVLQSHGVQALERALVFDDDTATRAATMLGKIGDAKSIAPVVAAMTQRVVLAQTLEGVLTEILHRHLKEVEEHDLRAIIELHDIKTGEQVDLGRFHTWNIDLEPLHDLARHELERRGLSPITPSYFPE